MNAQYLAATSLRKMLEGGDYWKVSAEKRLEFFKWIIEQVLEKQEIGNNIGIY